MLFTVLSSQVVAESISESTETGDMIVNVNLSFHSET